MNNLKDYADYRIINYKDCNDNLLCQKVDCSFYDEYNEKTDSTPIRTLKLHTDKYGNYIIHNHKRFYLVKEKP